MYAASWVGPGRTHPGQTEIPLSAEEDTGRSRMADRIKRQELCNSKRQDIPLQVCCKILCGDIVAKVCASPRNSSHIDCFSSFRGFVVECCLVTLVTKVWTSPRNLTLFTRPFLLIRGWNLEMRLPTA